MKVLALSSSRVGGGGFLNEAKNHINAFLKDSHPKVAFIPFASVQRDYESYGQMVKDAIKDLGFIIESVQPDSGRSTLESCDVIMVGGGNTFKLLHDLYDLDLFELIREKVQNNTPYIGWSAGANIAGKSICTTNDMPVIQPRSFEALNFFPFQLNPHYINIVQDNFHGETRDQRLEEFCTLHPDIPVVALPEGTALLLEGQELVFNGTHDAYMFIHRSGSVLKEAIKPNTALNDLLMQNK